MAGTTHFNKVSGVNGLYSGANGSEVQNTDASGNLYQAGTKITSSATEINQLASAGAVKADLEKLHAVTATATELNKLTGAGAIVASGTQASAIADATVAVGDAPTKTEFDAVVTKLNSALAALEAFGIIAGA